jgi:hypothetical protein
MFMCYWNAMPADWTATRGTAPHPGQQQRAAAVGGEGRRLAVPAAQRQHSAGLRGVMLA